MSTAIFTSTPTLTYSELDSMLLLSDSELSTLLAALPLDKRKRLWKQLKARAQMDPRMPMAPTVRQADFLGLDCPEALYGGAAGGGKSEALLMWLAEGIEIPSYSGIIFRRTFKQLSKSNDSLIAKSMRLYPMLGGRWNGTEKQWRFPSGAMIEMGALEHENSVLNYQGPAYHRAAFDELNQFTQGQYEFIVNTRMRSVANFPITLGARSSSNPGGNAWVMPRFITDEALDFLTSLNPTDPTPVGLVFYNAEGRAFVPARSPDNPWLDMVAYRKQLSQLTDPVMRERMMNGDWRIMPDGLIRAEWIRRYTMRGQHLQWHRVDGTIQDHVDERECQRIMTIDTAGTEKDKIKESKGKQHSYSVAQIWDYLPRKFGRRMLLRHVWRDRVSYPDLKANVLRLAQEWHPHRIKVEDAHFGRPLKGDLCSKIPITTISPAGNDKVTRATDLLNMLEAGEVYLPDETVPGVGAWLSALQSEWLSWQGLDTDMADQIDTAAYAAMDICKGAGRVVKLAIDPREVL